MNPTLTTPTVIIDVAIAPALSPARTNLGKSQPTSTIQSKHALLCVWILEGAEASNAFTVRSGDCEGILATLSPSTQVISDFYICRPDTLGGYTNTINALVTRCWHQESMQSFSSKPEITISATRIQMSPVTAGFATIIWLRCSPL
jgi:hypothetical protein